MALVRIRASGTDLVAILAIWAILPATMLALQGLGFAFGFDIWPQGEFRTWLAFLDEGPGYGAAKLFWALDHRNALSPWWYLAARPLINAVPSAPLILHLLSGLFIGIAAYLLMAELTRSRSFAVTIGMLSSLFLANWYRDEVIWNFLGALGCSLLSIWFFALFSNNRSRSGCLAASYLTWFVAVSTYTIQIGAMAGIFFVSLRARLSVASWFRATCGALLDIVPYAALLLLYIMIWITTSPAFIPGAYRTEFTFGAFAKSIASGIWSDHYVYFWIWLIAAGPRLMIVIFGLLIMTSLFLLVALRPSDRTRPSMPSLGFAFLIGICIAAPTIGLESVSDMWTPGTRWPMLMQFWSPFLFCVTIFAILSQVQDRYWWPLWLSLTACAAAFAILLVLGFNHTLVTQTRQERAFFAELKAIVTRDRILGKSFPRRYFIELADAAPFFPAPLLTEPYAHTILGPDVTFEAVKFFPEASDKHTFLVWEEGGLAELGGMLPHTPTQSR